MASPQTSNMTSKPRLDLNFQVPSHRMTADEKALYQRIAESEDLSSITRAERNQVFQNELPDEEDRLCQEKVGLSMAELKEKVMTSSDTLTETEVDIILKGAKWDRDIPNSGRKPLWYTALVDDEYELVRKVRALLSNDYDNEVYRLAYFRSKDFGALRKDRSDQKRQEQLADRAAKLEAARPQWVHKMFDAKLPRWGFVIFLTTYTEGTDQKWRQFEGTYNNSHITHLSKCWKRAASLSTKHKSMFVSETLLQGADMNNLRQRFKATRAQNEIPNGIATDCFLVVDDTLLNHSIISSQTLYEPKTPDDMDPWQNTLFVKAVDPDYDDTVLLARENHVPGFEGELTIPLPKVFDWLYYCFLTKSEDWETRYKNTEEGPAELLDPLSPYPAYRSRTNVPVP